MLFVVDTIGRTGPLEYESFFITAPERAGRALFIADDNGRCPSVEAVGINPREHAIRVVLSEHLEEAARRLLDLRRFHQRGPMPAQRVVAESWESLPSTLMMPLASGLNGQYLLSQARNSTKDLVSLLLPLTCLDDRAVQMVIELSWEFSRSPNLVGLYLLNMGLAIIRRNFFVSHPEFLGIDIAVRPPGELTWEEINRPDPVNLAVSELCLALQREAQRKGLEFRFANR